MPARVKGLHRTRGRTEFEPRAVESRANGSAHVLARIAAAAFAAACLAAHAAAPTLYVGLACAAAG